MVHKYPHLLCNNYTIPFIDSPVFDIWLYIIFSKFTVKEKNSNFLQYHQKIQPTSFSATLGLSCLDLNHKNVRSSQVGKKGCEEKTKLYL